MGKGSKRAYKVVPVEDESAFGDPPRNWGRVASMAGAWAIVLLAGAWMAPGFASGGNEEDTDARDQDPITARQAAARYLEAGLDGDSKRASAVLCDDASPQVLDADLTSLRDHYDEVLGSYPEIEVSTSEPVATGSGMDVSARVSFIGDSIFYEEFTVTVLATGDSYCVSQIERIEADGEEDSGIEIDPQEHAAKFLSASFVVRDAESASSYLCAEYSGPDPRELSDALAEWETVFGEAIAIQNFNGEPVVTGNLTEVPMSVELSSSQAVETFFFEVSVEEDCVVNLSGGEALLNPSND